MKGQVLPVLFLAFWLASCSAPSANNSQSDLPTHAGTWRQHCTSGAGSVTVPDNSDTATIELNSNQIVIAALMQQHTSETQTHVSFTLVDPVDLGAGGMRLPWMDFDRDSVIATMDFAATQATFRWRGFYNNKTHRREWVKEADLSNENAGLLLKLCRQNGGF